LIIENIQNSEIVNINRNGLGPVESPDGRAPRTRREILEISLLGKS